jgi:hypothetical protein
MTCRTDLSLHPNRRIILFGAAATAIPATSNRSAASGPDFVPTRLRLSPPQLSNPVTIEVTDELLGTSPRDPSGRRELQLGAGDFVLKLPTNRPLTRKLQINGAARGSDLKQVARNIVIIGGAVHPRINYTPTTMRLLDDSDYALYVNLGFTGATGGSFRIRVRETASEPYTAHLPWTANADDILTALRNIPGIDKDGVFTVAGSGVGGPWKIVPGANSKLGRPVLDTTQLEGPITTSRTHFWHPALDSVWLKFWTGVVHLEGLDLGGAHGGDGIQVMNPFRDARLKITNTRSVSNFHTFHNDWQHLDGAQM